MGVNSTREGLRQKALVMTVVRFVLILTAFDYAVRWLFGLHNAGLYAFYAIIFFPKSVFGTPKKILVWISNVFARAPKNIEGTVPIAAWKVARVACTVNFDPFSKSPAVNNFRLSPLQAVNGAPDYEVDARAVCKYGDSASVPHETTDPNHRCGFYVYKRRRMIDEQLRAYQNCYPMRVEIYGNVIEGSKRIYRAENQRVMKVLFFDVCEKCKEFIPRPAIGFAITTGSFVMPVCSEHLLDYKPERQLTLQQLADGLQTEVVFTSTWLSRWSRRRYPI